jgi:hypothetical protein
MSVAVSCATPMISTRSRGRAGVGHELNDAADRAAARPPLARGGLRDDRGSSVAALVVRRSLRLAAIGPPLGVLLAFGAVRIVAARLIDVYNASA